MSQAPAQKRNRMSAQSWPGPRCHRLTAAVIGVVVAVLCAPTVSTARRRSANVAETPATDILDAYLNKNRAPKQRVHRPPARAINKAPTRTKPTSVKKPGPKKTHGPKKSTVKKQRGVRGKAQTRGGFRDVPFTARSWRLLRLTHLENRVNSLSPTEWAALVGSMKKAGQTAYAEFQKTKSDTALKLLEGIQEALELAAKFREQSGGKVTPIPRELPAELREGVADDYGKREAA